MNENVRTLYWWFLRYDMKLKFDDDDVMYRGTWNHSNGKWRPFVAWSSIKDFVLKYVANRTDD